MCAPCSQYYLLDFVQLTLTRIFWRQLGCAHFLCLQLELLVTMLVIPIFVGEGGVCAPTPNIIYLNLSINRSNLGYTACFDWQFHSVYLNSRVLQTTQLCTFSVFVHNYSKLTFVGESSALAPTPSIGCVKLTLLLTVGNSILFELTCYFGTN